MVGIPQLPWICGRRQSVGWAFLSSHWFVEGDNLKGGHSFVVMDLWRETICMVGIPQLPLICGGRQYVGWAFLSSHRFVEGDNL